MIRNQVKHFDANGSFDSHEAGTGNMTLFIQDYRQWFLAIKQNDTDAVSRIIDSVTNPDEKDRLLNGEFDFRDEDVLRFCPKRILKIRVTRPLSVAVLFRADDVSKLLLRLGADPDNVEPRSRGGTLLHSMVMLANLEPNLEDRIVDCYSTFALCLSEPARKKLLYMEDDDGFRVLELAARTGFVKMVRAVLETPGVYLCRQEENGLLTYQWYDLSEYESRAATRSHKSPIVLLALCDEDAVQKQEIHEFFQWMPITQWYKAKTQQTKYMVAIWCVVRLIHMIAYFMSAIKLQLFVEYGGLPDDGETDLTNASFVFCPNFVEFKTPGIVQLILSIYVTFHAICILLFDVQEFIRAGCSKKPRFMEMAMKKRNPGVTVAFFRSIQIILALCLVIGSLLSLFASREVFGSPIVDIINLLTVMAAFYSVMYFAQVLPSVGPYIITVMRMMRDLAMFILIYICCLTPFAFYFMLFSNTRSHDQCHTEFSTFLWSMYSCFAMMLNMVDMTAFDVSNQWVLFCVHISYVFMVAVLLINFLIAIMSSSAAYIWESKNLIVKFERIYMAYIVEYRLDWALRRYFVWMKRNSFEFEEDGRVFAVNIKWNHSGPLPEIAEKVKGMPI